MLKKINTIVSVYLNPSVQITLTKDTLRISSVIYIRMNQDKLKWFQHCYQVQLMVSLVRGVGNADSAVHWIVIFSTATERHKSNDTGDIKLASEKSNF